MTKHLTNIIFISWFKKWHKFLLDREPNDI